MHWDLKPENILVTKWDVVINTPTIKLIDFSIASIDLEGKTYYRSLGYVALKVLKANELKEI
jgi:serine/threonine protein kinase